MLRNLLEAWDFWLAIIPGVVVLGFGFHEPRLAWLMLPLIVRHFTGFHNGGTE